MVEFEVVWEQIESMIKAVFLDLHDTLAHYHPPREELHVIACRKQGIEVKPEDIRPALPAADTIWREENIRSPIDKRSQEGKLAAYARYEGTLLRKAGTEISDEMAGQVLLGFPFSEMKFILFDDTLPALKALKKRGLTLGLISNVDMDVDSLCRELGLSPYLDLTVTSGEVGADKPEPPIFLAALERSGAKANEAMHVGDQYDSDVMGARGVGINPVLIDRDDLFPYVTDCPRIRSLTELERYL